jgi:PilZ domain
MPFTIRQFRRLPACCPATYHRGQAQGFGTVWNLSVSGFRFSGDVPLQIGETCSLTISLPNQEPVYVAAGIVRLWRSAYCSGLPYFKYPLKQVEFHFSTSVQEVRSRVPARTNAQKVPFYF